MICPRPTNTRDFLTMKQTTAIPKLSVLKVLQGDPDVIEGALPFGFGQIEGPAFLNGPNITWNGTINGFWDHVHKLNPNYDEDFKDVLAAQLAENNPEDNPDEADTAARKKTLTCRNDDPSFQINCRSLQEGIDHLHGVTASCSAPARTCWSVYCTGSQHIYLCNWVSHDQTFCITTLYRIAFLSPSSRNLEIEVE